MTWMESNANAAHLNSRTVQGGRSSLGFEELALPLVDSVYNFAHWLAQNEADAEDLVQETYLKAWRAYATFQPGSNFRAWIFKILRNTFLSARATAQRRGTAVPDSEDILPQLPANSCDLDSILIYRARLEAVRIAIEQLPVVSVKSCCCAMWKKRPTVISHKYCRFLWAQ